ncbi:hypothetical protein DYB32_005274 [Aphanomyces invadans]|uniref:Sulfhydryl oxidase n=1 Tax=Aphanomyces invadans TaxID=157072 RepID=A0A418AV06_9STRA|nr:hypothetical protein DYB32_005274 [Aphanomyces invadans]
MDWEQCAIYKVKGFPSLSLWNFDKNMNFENRRAIGEHTFDEVLGLVAQMFREQVFNETGEWPAEGTTTVPPPVKATTTLRPLWEESTLPSNATTRVLDAASAFVFGMRESVFTGRKTLEDDELDALKEWLHIVSLTFPGEAYRQLLSNLYKQVASVSLLTKDKWNGIFQGWQDHTSLLHDVYIKSVHAPEEWELQPTLFQGHGTTYYACELYTCGQWTMFHLMTLMVGPAASDELAISVVMAIRRFVRHFLTCLPCRKHFLAYNTLELVENLSKEPNKPRALYLWLWKMHNIANKRIRHYQWPKPDKCAACGVEGMFPAVFEHWLKKTYGFEAFKPKPVVTVAPSTTAPPVVHDAMSERDNLNHQPPVDATTIPVIGLANHAHGWRERVKQPEISVYAWYLLPVMAFVAFFALRHMRSAHRHGTHFRAV